MSYRFKLFRTLSVFSMVLLLSVAALADTIRLKDGSTIKGKILSYTNGQFIILIGTGERQRQLRFFADEIESIEFDSLPAPTVGATNANPAEKGPSFSTERNGDSTIITVGSASKTPNPQMIPPPVATEDPKPPVTEPGTIGTPEPKKPGIGPGVKPIQIKVKVLADDTANGWTNAGWVVKKGQRIRISGSGRISLGSGRYSGPEGILTLPDTEKLIGDKPTGGLIAVIGDDNNDFIYVGDSLDFIAQRDGALFLGVNEGNLDDNSGSFEVMVEIDPATGS